MTSKHDKEAFVTGHTGGSVWEPQLVMGHLLVNVLRSVPQCFSAPVAHRHTLSLFPRVACETGVLLLPVLVALTLGAGNDFSSNTTPPAFFSAAFLVSAAALLAPSDAPRVRRCLRSAATATTLSKDARHSLPNAATATPTPTPTPKQTFRRPFSVVFRAYLQLVTVVAILAVDFNVFPRRFAKTEAFGFSLMDLGVGGFVFSNGFVAGPRLKLKPNTPQSRWNNLRKSANIALPILVLGGARFALTKGVDYQEHVTEYGVHWNFFFTLGFIPLLTAFLQFLLPNIHFGIASAFILAAYQYLLTAKGLEEFILHAPRVGSVFALNREGICSFLGYWAISLLASYIGERVLTTHEVLAVEEAPALSAYKKQSNGNASQIESTTTAPATAAGNDRFSIDLLNLIDLFGFLTATTTLFAWLRYEQNIEASRRMANASYALWVVCVSLSLLFGTLLVDFAFSQFGLIPTEQQLMAQLDDADFLPTTTATKPSRSVSRGRSTKSENDDENTPERQASPRLTPAESVQVYAQKQRFVQEYLHRLRTPLVFDAVNRNQLAVFLVANILTGLVNLSMDTLAVDNLSAFFVLWVYLSVVVGMAVWWNEMGWTLNLNRFGSGKSGVKGVEKNKKE
ncbi:Glucosaminyl phosphatidylinositol (GlcN-PI) nositol acylation protein [Podochytrium sp. JEL0797]|nr:Glucosaminyl phosphatidylinositol (GlcN-PI) nositol acylation protein [Podochytrium sp. JEL0797]